MLYYQAIDPKALELLREFSRLTVFKEMRLAGGTALALQIGHRKSVDIDLFGKINADEFSLTEQLKAIGKTTILSFF